MSFYALVMISEYKEEEKLYFSGQIRKIYLREILMIFKNVF